MFTKQDVWRWIKKAFVSDTIIPFIAVIIFGMTGKVINKENIMSISKLPLVVWLITTIFYLSLKGAIIEFVNKKIK